jgi:hypothetical protein
MYLNENLKPVAFHPYTSSVRDRIFQAEYNHDDQIYDLQNQLIELFREAGINAYRDNKTVFELDYNESSIFYGFYDWTFSIGLSCKTR